jgi:hypothetical protein
MESTTARKYALAGGLLYLATFAFSIPTLGMKAPLDNADFVLGAGSATSVTWASFFDVLTALAGVGTAVALYPVTRRFSRSAAIGFVSSRVIEAGILVVGAMSLLSLVTLRDAGTGDTASLLTTGESLVALHDWSFLFGPGFMAVVNAAMLGSVMYRSGLVPRAIPLIGLVGAPLLFASDIAVLFGMHEQVSASAMLATLPIAAWELSVGVYMTFKGFRRPVDVADAPVASPALAA